MRETMVGVRVYRRREVAAGPEVVLVAFFRGLDVMTVSVKVFII